MLLAYIVIELHLRSPYLQRKKLIELKAKLAGWNARGVVTREMINKARGSIPGGIVDDYQNISQKIGYYSKLIEELEKDTVVLETKKKDPFFKREYFTHPFGD